MRRKWLQVLLTLEPSYREVLTLRFHEEMSLEEIAGVTRAPLSTVKSRLYRGLAALKPQLLSLRARAERGGAADESLFGDESQCAGIGGEPHASRGARAGAGNARAAASAARSLWVPLAISSVLLPLFCYATWAVLDGYDLTPNGLPDASDQLMIMLMWMIPVTLLVVAVVWYKRTRVDGHEVSR